MNRLHSVFKKYLMSQPFFEDGFEYQFISVESIEDSSLVFTVNVLLPKKGQSFVVETFSYGIMKILNIASRFFDEDISYTENILIEGKPAPKSGIYINPEDGDEIFRSLNENVRQVTLSNHKDISSVHAKISFSPNKERSKFYSMESSPYIEFYIRYDISNIEYNDTPVHINQKMFDNFGEVFNEKLQNSGKFGDTLNEIIFNVLEPSIKIRNVEIYIESRYWINKIDGMETIVRDYGSSNDFIPEMFIQTS